MTYSIEICMVDHKKEGIAMYNVILDANGMKDAIDEVEKLIKPSTENEEVTITSVTLKED